MRSDDPHSLSRILGCGRSHLVYEIRPLDGMARKHLFAVFDKFDETRRGMNVALCAHNRTIYHFRAPHQVSSVFESQETAWKSAASDHRREKDTSIKAGHLVMRRRRQHILRIQLDPLRCLFTWL